MSCVAFTLGATLAILGVVVAFDIGIGLAQSICSPPLQTGSSIVFLIVVAPIANTARLCARNPYHDIGLLVMFFGMTLLGVGLFLVVVGGAAVFGVRL